MYGNDWIDRAKELRDKALAQIAGYQNYVQIEEHYSEDYMDQMLYLALLDYADLIISNELDGDYKELAIAIKYGIVDYNDASYDTKLSLNIKSFDVLEAIVKSHMYPYYEFSFDDWETDNQIILIVDLLKVYYSDESHRVTDIWDDLPWDYMYSNVVGVFEHSMLEQMNQVFDRETFDVEALESYLALCDL